MSIYNVLKEEYNIREILDVIDLSKNIPCYRIVTPSTSYILKGCRNGENPKANDCIRSFIKYSEGILINEPYKPDKDETASRDLLNIDHSCNGR